MKFPKDFICISNYSIVGVWICQLTCWLSWRWERCLVSRRPPPGAGPWFPRRTWWGCPSCTWRWCQPRGVSPLWAWTRLSLRPWSCRSRKTWKQKQTHTFISDGESPAGGIGTALNLLCNSCNLSFFVVVVKNQCAQLLSHLASPNVWKQRQQNVRKCNNGPLLSVFFNHII